jgi:lysozyme
MRDISMKNIMKLSARGLQEIKNHEGWRDHVYKDAVGLPTIGYGHLIRKGEVFPPRISKEYGEKLLQADLVRFEKRVHEIVKVPLTQNQYDVLVSFLFNLGVHALDGSTSLKLLNKGLYQQFADRLLLWNKGMIGGKLVEIQGLTNRRIKERKLFLER